MRDIKKILIALLPILGVLLIVMIVTAESALSPTSSSVLTAKIVTSPISDPRLAYVQQKLVAAGFNETEVNTLLGDSRKTVFPASTVAYKAPNWAKIRQKLYSTAYVREGKNYFAANRDTFAKAKQQYGVPGEVITGVIAIETEFGRNTGSTPTFNAIYSRLQQSAANAWNLSAERLVALSRYCIEEKLDCYEIKGSYAGAIGIVQFMPDSLMRFGVDGDQDGVVDLHKPADAIPSAANFLKAHGWAQNQKQALARYYGTSVGYPDIVLRYAALVAQ